MNTWRKKENKGATDKGRYRQLKKTYWPLTAKARQKRRNVLQVCTRRAGDCQPAGKRARGLF